MPRRNGPTLLAIPLLRRGRIDSVIFVGLIVILIYNNVTNHGALITTWLLSALALMGFYIFWMPRRNGPTLLAIPLLRRGRIDSVIFVGLIVILI
ncbi:DUF986 family protein, partial [Enterobacter hormaechei]|uniref:DUF986 family protein n=1 Tax=Enterobacter hormaechei TaxID=158836 RepID=UPI0013FE37A8